MSTSPREVQAAVTDLPEEGSRFEGDDLNANIECTHPSLTATGSPDSPGGS